MSEDIRPEGAVRAAKAWLARVYADEAIARIALEEVRFRDGNWEITLGFNRFDPESPAHNSRRSKTLTHGGNGFTKSSSSPETIITSWRCGIARSPEPWTLSAARRVRINFHHA